MQLGCIEKWIHIITHSMNKLWHYVKFVFSVASVRHTEVVKRHRQFESLQAIQCSTWWILLSKAYNGLTLTAMCARGLLEKAPNICSTYQAIQFLWRLGSQWILLLLYHCNKHHFTYNVSLNALNSGILVGPRIWACVSKPSPIVGGVWAQNYPSNT